MTATTPQCKVEMELTDEIVAAALSEYWDLSPRGWPQTQIVAMRKSILTALAALPESTGGMVNSALIDPLSETHRTSSEGRAEMKAALLEAKPGMYAKDIP